MKTTNLVTYQQPKWACYLATLMSFLSLALILIMVAKQQSSDWRILDALLAANAVEPEINTMATLMAAVVTSQLLVSAANSMRWIIPAERVSIREKGAES